MSDDVHKYLREIGRKGGQVSGARRMTNYTAEERSAIALTAARARWGDPVEPAKSAKRPKNTSGRRRPRGICSTCGLDVPICKDGTLRGHWPSRQRVSEEQWMQCGNGWSRPTRKAAAPR